MRLLVYLFSIICHSFCFSISAQTIVEPQVLSIEDGLSQGFISVLHKDSEGFLWIGTKNGLNRYDGRQFEVFTHDHTDPYSISNDWTCSIIEETDFLLTGSFEEPVLNLFHKKSKRFFEITFEEGFLNPTTFIRHFIKTNSGKILIVTGIENKLIEIQFPDRFWEKIPDDEALLNQVTFKTIIENLDGIAFTEKGNLMVYKEGQFHEFDIETLEYKPIDKNSPFNQFNNFNQVHPSIGLSVIEDNPSDRQLLVFRNGQWQKVDSDLNFGGGTFFEKDANRVWLQESENNELLIFEVPVILQKDQLMKEDASVIIKNINTAIGPILKDESNVVWIATGGVGLRKISPRKLNVKTYQLGQTIYSRIFSSSPGEVIYLFHGLSSFYKAGEKDILKYVFQLRNSNDIHRIFWMDDGLGKGWLATIAKNDNSFDYMELKLYHYSNDQFKEVFSQKLQEFWPNSELSALKTNDAQIVLSYANLVIRYSPETKQTQSLTLDLFEGNQTHIFNSAQTANGDIWIGSSEGLIRGIQNQGDFTFQLVDQGLNNSVCASLLTDPLDSNTLWVGTKGGGLHRLDTKNMHFEYLNSKNGLPNDVIYGVLNDDGGNLWMSSNKGIIRYTPSTGLIRNFTSEDGMQSDEFNTFAYGKSTNGDLLFGGINGLNVFHPKDLKDNPQVPTVRLTGLSINNKSIHVNDSLGVLKEAIEFTEDIKLPFSQNNLTLTFAALEFTTPGKNKFNYYLEGAEEDWGHQSTDNKAKYLNIAPGTYIFKVKAANGDGVWSKEVRTLKITILPPWYRTTLAYIFYVLLIAFGIWWYLRFQRKRLELQHRLALESKESERLKELEAFRSRLFTNITHEFRTPLTVILGSAQRLESQKQDNNPEKKQLSLIRRNGDNLLNLVNQMLDLSKLEHGELPIHYEQGDILKYLRYISESFYSNANFRNVMLKVESNETEIWMDFDPEKIRQIISNLLSNAIKYTPSGGKVTLQAIRQGEQLHIMVKDSGQGIPKEDLSNIFNRFYQVNEDVARQGGTGIGLALTNELVNLLDGTISVESELKKGSSFKITLPIKQKASRMSSVPTSDSTVINKPEEISKSDIHEKDAPRLLIIEDNLDVVEFLSTCLEDSFQLSFAYNGKAGTEKALEEIPDIIISDVMMPEKTGFEVTDFLKNDERTSHIPIILLTAKADVESRIVGLKRGADAYLPKPFHPEELLANLKNLLALRQKLQSKYQSLATGLPTTSIEPIDDPEQIFLEKLGRSIEDELDNADLKAEDIAKAVGMSRSNLYAKLSAVTGMSFNIYLRTLRLKKAKALLESSSLNISEVAYQVGFTNLSYFSNQFSKQFGYAPSKLRE